MIKGVKPMNVLSLFLKNEQGGGLVEYTLIVALIALAAITAITTVGTKVTADFTSIANKL
jgi:pilus assembly protein Flp/PilA